MPILLSIEDQKVKKLAHSIQDALMDNDGTWGINIITEFYAEIHAGYKNFTSLASGIKLDNKFNQIRESIEIIEIELSAYRDSALALLSVLRKINESQSEESSLALEISHFDNPSNIYYNLEARKIIAHTLTLKEVLYMTEEELDSRIMYINKTISSLLAQGLKPYDCIITGLDALLSPYKEVASFLKMRLKWKNAIEEAHKMQKLLKEY